MFFYFCFSPFSLPLLVANKCIDSMGHLYNSDCGSCIVKTIRLSETHWAALLRDKPHFLQAHLWRQQIVQRPSSLIIIIIIRLYWQGEKSWCSLPLGTFTSEMSPGGFTGLSVSAMRWKCCMVNAPFTCFTHKASDLHYPEAVSSLNTVSNRRCIKL